MLSSAFVTNVRLSQNLSLNVVSVSGFTSSSSDLIFTAGFILSAAARETWLLCLPTSSRRNRNCRFRLLTSIVSPSVVVMWPSGPEPTPSSAKFFSSSQPSAPQPTMNVRALAILSWKALPHTEMMSSYREPTRSVSVGVASGPASKKSKCSHCSTGEYLPVSFTTSCAMMPPKKVATGCRSAVDHRATLATTSSSSSSSASAVCDPDMRFSVLHASLRRFARATTSATSSSVDGRLPSLSSSKSASAWKAKCSCSARPNLAPSVKASPHWPGATGCTMLSDSER
mmetsp:Transcript_2864/g.10127  ORF Transcript_2864/g.10127 Transcript_2864/m.10127 type:complete len:285 (-) Transcript_2864:1160-2014(-)